MLFCWYPPPPPPPLENDDDCVLELRMSAIQLARPSLRGIWWFMWSGIVSCELPARASRPPYSMTLPPSHWPLSTSLLFQSALAESWALAPPPYERNWLSKPPPGACWLRLWKLPPPLDDRLEPSMERCIQAMAAAVRRDGQGAGWERSDMRSCPNARTSRFSVAPL